MDTVDLSDEIAKTLIEYSKDVEEELEREKEAIAQEAVAKLKRAGSFSDTSGKYRKGWRVKKVGKKFVVHNATRYQVTHLLENGHATRRGGRTRAFPHISPVDDWVSKELPKRIQDRLGR